MAWLSIFEPNVCDWCKEKIDNDEPVVEYIDGWVCDFCSMTCYTYYVSLRNKRIEVLRENAPRVDYDDEATIKGI